MTEKNRMYEQDLVAIMSAVLWAGGNYRVFADAVKDARALLEESKR